MSKTKRTGKSLIHTINDCPTALMLTLGFTEEQSARIISVRRVLPLVEDSTVPCVPARKLWERIGKPHGRFRDWADDYIKPLLEQPGTFAEISAKLVQGKTGRPSQEYTLSRDVAADLAMQARTDEGRDIRRYFLDMEKLAIRLSGYLPLRAELILATDNEMTHHFMRKAGEAAKAGHIPKDMIKQVATAEEKAFKSLIAKVLTGKPAGFWRENIGDGRRGIRDILSPDDAALYRDCYNTSSVLVRAGYKREAVERTLKATYANRIDIADYLRETV